MTDTAGHVPISVAARLVGVHERTIRRWLAAGLLADSPGRSAGHRARLVSVDAVRELAAGLREPDTAGPASRTEPESAGSQPDSDRAEPDMSATAFLAVIERQQTAIMEMSGRLDRLQDERAELFGRLGYFQRRIHELEATVLALQAPAEVGQGFLSNSPAMQESSQSPPERDSSPTPVEAPQHTTDPVITAQRPWWKFWQT